MSDVETELQANFELFKEQFVEGLAQLGVTPENLHEQDDETREVLEMLLNPEIKNLREARAILRDIDERYTGNRMPEPM